MDIKEQKIAEIRKGLNNIICQIDKFASESTRLDMVESSLFKELLSLGLKLLNYYIVSVGIIVLQRGVPIDNEQEKMKNTGLKKRLYRSIFGMIEIIRPKYYSKTDKVHYALDKELGLPKGRMSYVLSNWLSYGAVDLDFRESVGLLNQILGQKLEAEQSSRCTYHLSEDVENYYDSKDWTKIEDKSCLSAGFDGKGVPILKSETQRVNESVSVRLSRGQKRQVKKEATVSVSSSFRPKKRTKEDIINSLFCVKTIDTKDKTQQLCEVKETHQWHENKHTRAFLSDKEGAIRYGIDNLLKRDSTQTKPIIILIDGDRSLRKKAEQIAEEKSITDRISAYVLDFIHVIEYVWKVANAYKGEKNPQREEWVKKYAEKLLMGQVNEVIDDWKKVKGDGENEAGKPFSINQLHNINRGITYFENHTDMMRYDEYLEQGYPITTGAIESACGHFVKSRMERNAMHWSIKGAQKMLNIRAVKKNDDWQEYQKAFIDKEQIKLYKLAS